MGRRGRWIAWAITALAACVTIGVLHSRQAAAPQAPGSTAVSTAVLDHVVVIVEENKTSSDILGSKDAPYLNRLIRNYAYAADYHSVTHPSLPNYLALTSGTTAGITSDCNPPGGVCQADVTNIADRIEASGRTWKMYAEDMPVPCGAHNASDYAVKHNPYMYYPDITGNTTRCRGHVVPFSSFTADLRATSTLPNFSFISPNLCNDMHNCPVATGDSWLSMQIPKILASPAFTQQRSLLVIVWDENDGGGPIPALFIGPNVRRGFVTHTHYDHYSLLHTIESSWHLRPLTGNDAAAPVMTDLLQ